MEDLRRGKTSPARPLRWSLPLLRGHPATPRELNRTIKLESRNRKIYMEEWIKCKIGDIVDIHRGASPRPIQNFISSSGMPWVKISDATASTSRFITETKEFIIEEGISKSVVVNPGDLIVSNSATPGLPKFLQITACIHDGWLYFSNYKNVTKEFLYYKFFDIQRNLNNLANGSVFQNLKTDIVKDFDILLPPLSTQQKIAQILSSLDDKIELNNKINANLEQQAQALFKSWFVDFEPFGGEMPAGWRVGTLSDVADYYNGYAFSSKELLDEPNDDCFDVFKQGHIVKGGGFNADGTKSWFPKAKCDKLQNFILKKGDILMAMTDMKGNVAILGNTAIMPIDDKYIVNQRVGLLRAKKELEVDYPYLYLLTNEHDFLMDLRSRANSGVQVNLSSTAIKESQINVATNEDYKKFNNLVLPLFEKILANQLENTKLSNLRDTLLPKLMNGEIEV